MDDFLSGLSALLHRIRVKLYPGRLPGQEEGWIAKTDNEKTVSVEEVLTSALENGRLVGSLPEGVKYVTAFLREAAHRLCDGFAVNFLLFSVHPHVTKIFKSKREGVSEEDHPVTFRFRILYELRQLAKYIQILVEGVAGETAWIDEFWDVKTDTINQKVTPGGLFAVTGPNIKVVGKDSRVLLVCDTSTPKISIGVGTLVENDAGRVAGMVPDLLMDKTWKVEIRTRYSGGGKELKDLRVITRDYE